MRGSVRLGDMTFGVCVAHKHPKTVKGRIITSSGDTNTNSRGAARLGDMVLTDCGHVGYITTSSGTVDVNSRGAARLGDKIGGGPYIGYIVTASGDVFTD